MPKKIKIVEEKPKQFIIVNELAQVFYGLKAGNPQFTDDWNIAKPLTNDRQFKMLQRGTLYKLEIVYL